MVAILCRAAAALLMVACLAVSGASAQTILGAKMYGSSGGATEVDVRLTETNMGNFMADAALWSVQRDSSVTDKPYIAILNGGGFNASWDAGLEVSNADVLKLSPFKYNITVVSVPGSTLLALLENAYSRIRSKDLLGITPVTNTTTSNTTDYRASRFAQVAGLQVYVNGTGPQYKRVLRVNIVNGLTGKITLLLPTANYTVVTNDYMANGGDDFFGFKPSDCTAPTATSPCGKGVIKPGGGGLMTAAITDYIANQTAMLTHNYPLGYVATSTLYKGITTAYRFYQCDNLPWATDQVCRSVNNLAYSGFSAPKDSKGVTIANDGFQATVTFLATFNLVITEFPFNNVTEKDKFIKAFEAGITKSCGQAGCVVSSKGWAAGSVVGTVTVLYPTGTSISGAINPFTLALVNSPAAQLSTQTTYFDSIPGFSLSSGFVASGVTTTAVTKDLKIASKTFEYAGAVRTGSAALGAAAITTVAVLLVMLL